MTDSFVFVQSNQLLPSNKHSSLSLLKNYDVSVVQSTNYIIILLPIPSLPKPPFLTMLISCKHSCCFSPLRNTVYPMRKLTIRCGNRPPLKHQGKLPLTHHNITPLLDKTQLSKQITSTEAWYAPHIHKTFHSHHHEPERIGSLNIRKVWLLWNDVMVFGLRFHSRSVSIRLFWQF